MVYQLTKFHVQRVDMVINPPWNLPFLGAKGLTSPEQMATVEMVFSRPWTCTFLVAKGLATPELMANADMDHRKPEFELEESKMEENGSFGSFATRTPRNGSSGLQGFNPSLDYCSWDSLGTS
ncbi:hypothetical protein Tco_1054965 [Tanacetum coccineum]|uniref:Uncharacterized protein n=1 Tax=Tanacetum coccineum TaxID=301880 RepID=A0ABQ5GYA7_9ASTR